MSDEIEIESIPGLPQDLPPGERVVWQGRPEWKALARNTFKVVWIAAYFAVFVAARFVVALREGQGMNGVVHTLEALLVAAGCLGILALFAWMNARATIYTITTHRVALRIGVAIPMTWNLPFKRLASADLVVRKEGDGDISLQLTAPNRIAWLHLWPHTRPFHFVKAQPTLRTIAEPAKVATLLADAMQTWASRSSAPLLVASRTAFPAADPIAVPNAEPSAAA